MNKLIKNLILFIFYFNFVRAYKYSIPGNQNWPTDLQFQEFKSSMNSQVVLRGDEQNYKPTTFNLRTNNPKPAAIVYVQNSDDIKNCLKFSKKHDLRITVWSTGHHNDIRNTADNSIQINMSKMKNKSINLQEQTVTVETGNIFGDIIKFVGEQSNNKLVCLSGADPSVGPYGWAIGGGHGRLTRMYGLGADAIKSIDLILVNGQQITTSELENQDLFRALRGSSGSTYGIILNITFQLYPNPGQVVEWKGIYLPYNDIAARFSDWIINAPNNAGGYYLLNNYPELNVLLYLFCYGSQQECNNLYQPLKINCLIDNQNFCQTQYFSDYYEYAKTFLPKVGGTQSVYVVSSALNSENITSALINANKFFRDNLPQEVGNGGCSGNAVIGGVSKNLDPYGKKTSVAPALRDSIMAITCLVNWGAGNNQLEPLDQYYRIQKMEEFQENILSKYGTDNWVYWNEPSHLDNGNNDWQQRYWGTQNNNYQQLLEVKKKYDPENFLTCYQCIGWDQPTDTDPAICPTKTCSCSNNPEGNCSYLPNIVSKILFIINHLINNIKYYLI